jgi:DNA-binding response OmpR family regulator/anti-sigma regulatory factor (Ser/Thr protein kinase)
MSDDRTAPEAHETPPETILVVDDAPDVRLILKRGLSKRGFGVILADDGEQGLSKAAEGGVDLILLDVLMPGLDGLEVCRRLKADPATADVPVIFLTGHDSAEMVVKGLEVGANDFVSKPIVLSTLLARVEVALRLRRAEQKERRAREASQEAYKQLAAAKSEIEVAHRMTGLTVLAAGLAHELNSPLGALATNISFLREELKLLSAGEQPDEETVVDLLDAANESAESCDRLSAVINRMKSYGAKARARSTDAFLIRPVLEQIARDAAGTHDVDWHLACPDDAQVFGVEAELQEALRAVVDNGFVAAAHTSRERAVVEIRVTDEGRQVQVVIIDSGDGIPDSDLPFVFDPFFTRKQAWRSVGLGLGMALSILERHAGEISIAGESELGGAEVTLRLPKQRTKGQGTHEASPEAPAAKGPMPIIPTLT